MAILSSITKLRVQTLKEIFNDAGGPYTFESYYWLKWVIGHDGRNDGKKWDNVVISEDDTRISLMTARIEHLDGELKEDKLDKLLFNFMCPGKVTWNGEMRSIEHL